jgi:hypothetical protein
MWRPLLGLVLLVGLSWAPAALAVQVAEELERLGTDVASGVCMASHAPEPDAGAMPAATPPHAQPHRHELRKPRLPTPRTLLCTVPAVFNNGAWNGTSPSAPLNAYIAALLSKVRS